jgi:hypothetical protein
MVKITRPFAMPRFETSWTQVCKLAYGALTLAAANPGAATGLGDGVLDAFWGRIKSHCSGSDMDQPAIVTWHDAAAVCELYNIQQKTPSCYQCNMTSGNDGTKDQVLRCKYSSNYGLSAAESDQGWKHLSQCKGFRLPTEAEWEYAYRAGTLTPYYLGTDTLDPLDDDANHSPCEANKTANRLGPYAFYQSETTDDDFPGTEPVKADTGFEANGWGVYFLGGNAAEWVDDRYLDPGDLAGQTGVQDDPWSPISTTSVSEAEQFHVARGGDRWSQAGALRGAARTKVSADGFDWGSNRQLLITVRCVRTLGAEVVEANPQQAADASLSSQAGDGGVAKAEAAVTPPNPVPSP